MASTSRLRTLFVTAWVICILVAPPATYAREDPPPAPSASAPLRFRHLSKEAVAAIRRNPALAPIPIIAVSASVVEMDREQSQRVSAKWGGGIFNYGGTVTIKGSEYYGFPAKFESVDFGGDKLSVP